MSNEDLKLEAIKKAYGDYFEDCNPDENGWCDYDIWFKFIGHKIDYDFYSTKMITKCMRPKSLSGIENNRGWIMIEEDGSNLPKTRGKEDVWLMCNDGKIHIGNTALLNEKELKKYWLRTISHYQPIIKPDLPLW